MAAEIKTEAIEQMLRARVDEFVPKLLRNAVLKGGYWCVANINDDPGEQMKINSSRGKQGLWTDWSAPQGSDDYSGDMLKLIAAVRFGGWSAPGAKKSAILWAKSELGLDDLDPGRLATVQREAAARQKEADSEAEAKKAQMRARAGWMWTGAQPIAGTAAQAYLEWRGVDFARLGKFPGALRFVPDAWCPVRRGKHPALIACIMGLDGALLGVHRTYLDVSAGKGGPVTNFKLPPDAKGRRKSHKLSLGYYAGGHIPLWKGAHDATLREVPAGTRVDGSEGIEDGLTIAMADLSLRILAGVSLSNLGGLALPPQAGGFNLIGQNDPLWSRATDSFERAIARQQEAAQRDGSKRTIGAYFPEPDFKDFNDQLRGIRMGAAA